jgi:hypothetical protein
MKTAQKTVHKTLKIASMILVAIGFSSCAVPQASVNPNFSAEKYNRVAIVAVAEQPDINPGVLRRMEDEFEMGIMKKGYSVVSRSDVERVMKEISFQNSGLTDSRGACQIGKVLNVRGIVLVSVNNVKTETHEIAASSGVYRDKKGRVSAYSHGPSQYEIASAAVSARLIDVETTDVMWIGQASSGGGDSPLSMLQSSFGEGMGGAENLAHSLAGKVADTFPSRFPKPAR